MEIVSQEELCFVLPKETPEIDVFDDTLQFLHERWDYQDKRHVRVLLQRQMQVKVPSKDKSLCEP